MSSGAFAGDIDPPARVARLSLIQGDVAFQAGDDQAPENAELNRPVTSWRRSADDRSELARRAVAGHRGDPAR